MLLSMCFCKHRLGQLRAAIVGWLAICLSLPLAGQIEVVTTTTMITDMVQTIAGDRAQVHGMMGPGVDPHLYKPTAADVRRLSRADVIFYNGLHLEGRMTDTLLRMARNGRQVYAVTEGIEEAQLLEPPEFEGHYDPHVWFDPRLWAQCVDVVVQGLSRTDNANAAYYAQQGEAYKARLLELHAWAEKHIAQIPPAQRILITSHDAYNYFGRAYGFQVIGVQGISTVTEAGLADMTLTVDFIRQNRIKAVFVESSVSPAAIERISRDSGAKLGGELFSDAMGTPGQIETGADGTRYDVGAYEGMVRHNVETIVKALK